MMSNDRTKALPVVQKRKAEHDHQDDRSKRPRFEHAARQREVRAIATQTSFKAFKHGELDVDKFVKSREFEIRALESGLVNSKKALTKRAFQLVPKDLRRRTASHNVQRVPKRLRARARKEMREDNTPTVTARKRKPSGHMRLRLETAKKLRKLSIPKSTTSGKATEASRVKRRKAINKMAEASLPKARFRKRQKYKAWLPTHMFHAKRARMTPPSQPMWRFALPITSTAKSYRSTHRIVSERGVMCWDMSYYSTVELRGRKSSMNSLLKALGTEKQLLRLPKHDVRDWLLGNRVMELKIYHRHRPEQLICPAALVWATKPASGEVEAVGEQQCVIWMRIHPSAFLELWKELVLVSKIVTPHIAVQDLRYEIGSIEVAGTDATAVLASTLQSVSHDVHDCALLQSLNKADAPVLNAGSMLSFCANDPRLLSSAQHSLSQNRASTLTETAQAQRHPFPELLDPGIRNSGKVPSQKSLDRRRRDCRPGQPLTRVDGDPSVPILMFSHPSQHKRRQPEQWTLMLPWRWVNIVWYRLMYTPLPSGAQPRFGGIEEARSLSLEYGEPSFPADYPITEAGWAWETEQRARRHADWKKRPKSKRISWDRLAISARRRGEIGQGWACDWEELLDVQPDKQDAKGKARSEAEDESQPPKGVKFVTQDIEMKDASSTFEPDKREVGPQKTPAAIQSIAPVKSSRPYALINVPGCEVEGWLGSSTVPHPLESAIFAVQIKALPQGVPEVCARVYALPAAGALRRKWIQQHPSFRPRAKTDVLELPLDTAPHEARRLLAQSLQDPPAAGEAGYPECPGKEDLIGFVTSGNYDLGAGRGMAIGSLSLRRVRDRSSREAATDSSLDLQNLCIVRNSGQTVARLAVWETIV